MERKGGESEREGGRKDKADDKKGKKKNIEKAEVKEKKTRR